MSAHITNIGFTTSLQRRPLLMLELIATVALIISIAVAEGQEVKAGETLAVVEAMKMENVLRADRDGVVKRIHARKGESLAVDAVILEFA